MDLQPGIREVFDYGVASCAVSQPKSIDHEKACRPFLRRMGQYIQNNDDPLRELVNQLENRHSLIHARVAVP